MTSQRVVNTKSGRSRDNVASCDLVSGFGRPWSFVYIFFTNGIPFDAPNRSEPCPLS